MALKRLDELTATELRIELKRAGIKGKFVKSQAIIRLTNHLNEVSEDPFTFEFDPEEPVEEVTTDSGTADEYEVLNDAPEAGGSGAAASVSDLINGISAGGSTTTASTTLPTTATPFVTTANVSSTSSGSATTTTFTTSSASYPYQNMGGMAGYVPTPNFQMYNPYNPVMYPGMPGGDFRPQYPGMMPQPQPVPSSGMSGMNPMGSTPPWNGMWTPWGGWTPMGSTPAPPAPVPATTPTASSRTASGTSFVVNPGMAEFTGACPPPARSSETKNTKITSGQFDSGRREVKERQNWPQVMIDHILNPEPVDYDEMDWASLTAGMTGKMLAEMDPDTMDPATVNKMKHLNRLANYGMKTPIKSILNFNAVLFRAVENKALSWQNWEKIEQFHTRHLSSLTVAAATSGVGKTAPASGSVSGSGGQGGTPSKKPNWETLKKSMTDHHMCYKFNRGQCDQEEDHDTNGNGKILLHACGKCTFANRGIVKNHGAQECKPDFWPAPFRSQHRTTGGGVVQN